MDVHKFHRDLLEYGGRMRTPEEFRLQDIHAALYTGFAKKGLHGFSSSKLDGPHFTATLTLALCLTQVINPVYLLVPKPHVRWVIDEIERVGRHIFRIRAKDKDGVLVLRRAFKQLRVTHEILRAAEPKHWVMFGFKNDDILPEWAREKLLAPLTGARETTA